jgi:hypothetical protein
MPKTRRKLPLLKSFMLAEEDLENLKALAAKQELSDSSIIRIALREHFTNNGLTVTERE